MPKQKTHKGAAKRFRTTGSGKVRRHHALMRHNLTSKRRKRKRLLRRSAVVDKADEAQTKRLLPYWKKM